MPNPTLEILQGALYGKGIHIGKLGSLGRVIAMLSGGKSDVVPFMGPQIHDHAMTVAKVPARRYYWDAELLVTVQMAVDRWYGFDSYTIIPDDYNFEVEALGAKFIYSEHAMPTVDVTHPLIQSPADLERVGALDPSRGRIPVALEIGRLCTLKAPGPLSGGFFCSHWSLICQAMGYPAAIRALKKDPGFARALFDWADEQVLYPFMQAYAGVGVKNATGADAWAAFPNLTPELIEQWVVPYADKLRQRCKSELHLTASAGSAAGDYCEEDPAKFDKALMFRCLDAGSKTIPIRVAFSGMGRTQDWDIGWLQEYAFRLGKGGHKVPIMASLNGRFMRDSRPEQIWNKVCEWIDILGRDGGLLMFIANIPADTPPINVHTAVQAVHKLGRYPIPADLDLIPVDLPSFQPFDEWLRGQPEEALILEAREWQPERERVLA